MEAFVGDKLLIGGHVPEQVIRYLLENQDEYDKLLVYQDEMHGEATEYKVWDFFGEIKTYSIDEPITTYLQEQPTPASKKSNSGSGFGVSGRSSPGRLSLTDSILALLPCSFSLSDFCLR